MAAKYAAESRWGGGNVRDISWRLHIMLWASGRALKIANDDAIYIECGTGRGYMAAGIAEYHNFKSNGPNFYLIDNFLQNCLEVKVSLHQVRLALHIPLMFLRLRNILKFIFQLRL
jgi:hypothetical protein